MLCHGIGAGEDGRHVPEERQEARNKDKRSTVPCEESLPDLDPSFGQPKPVAVTLQQLIAEPPADPKTDHFANNGGSYPDGDQQPDVEIRISGGEQPGRDQRSLGRQRKSDAFEGDESRHDPDAVDRYEVNHLAPPLESHPYESMA